MAEISIVVNKRQARGEDQSAIAPADVFQSCRAAEFVMNCAPGVQVHPSSHLPVR